MKVRPSLPAWWIRRSARHLSCLPPPSSHHPEQTWTWPLWLPAARQKKKTKKKGRDILEQGSHADPQAPICSMMKPHPKTSSGTACK